LRHARRPLRGRVTPTLLRRPAPDDPLREATDPDDAGAATWVVGPEAALALAGRGVPGWRIAVRQEGRREVVLDALLRARAAYLRADPARLEGAVGLCRLPGSEAACSVGVPGAGAARAALAAGAGDLVLDGADDGALGRLRDALTPASLAERVTIPPGVPLDRVRDTLARPPLQAYLAPV